MAVQQGDIKPAGNFQVNVAKPIDSKFQVDTFSDLANIGFGYAGLPTFVIDENKTYVLQSDLTTWLPQGASAVINDPVIDGNFNSGIIPLLTFVQNDGTGLDSNINLVFGIDTGNNTMTSSRAVLMGNGVAPLSVDIEGSTFLGSRLLTTLTNAENAVVIGAENGWGGTSNIFLRASNVIGKGNAENANLGAGLFEANVMGALNMRDYISDGSSYHFLTNVIGHRILRDATATNTQFQFADLIGSDHFLSATLTNFDFDRSSVFGYGHCINLVGAGRNQFNFLGGVGILENGELLGGFDFNAVGGVANLANAVTGGNRNAIWGNFNAQNARNFNQNTIVGFTCCPNIGAFESSPGVYDAANNNTVIGSNSGTNFRAGSNNVFIDGQTTNQTVNDSIAIGGEVTGDDQIVIGDSTKTVTIGGVTTAPDTTVKTPTSTGIAGQISYNSGFLYTCVATDTWVRQAVDTIW